MSVTERRVQLYLPEVQYRSVMGLAKEKHTSFAQVVREALEEFLRRNDRRWEEDPITDHVGAFDSKDKDLSIDHDHFIYDEVWSARLKASFTSTISWIWGVRPLGEPPPSVAAA